jgi:nitric-oxide synthase
MRTEKYYLSEAHKFLTNYYGESNLVGLDDRIAAVHNEIKKSGTWIPTTDELIYGGKIAWRNSNRCIGRLFYNTLEIMDFRHLETEEEIYNALIKHLKRATNNGKIVSVLSVFRADQEDRKIRIWNSKLVRYAGYEKDGVIIGDPSELDFTRKCLELGWKGKGSRFDVLPVVIQIGNQKPQWFDLPSDIVLEVEMTHPEFSWFRELNLKWYAVPVITDMVFKMGGIQYSAAPFNGWFMETEIGSRNFGDKNRYNLLPVIAKYMNLDTRSKINLWKDRALLELNRAVLYSFQKAGVTITDHHTASKQFISFCEKESQVGREVTADWSWIVPPMGSSTLDVFHHEWDNRIIDPNFYYQSPAWNSDSEVKVSSCPFHI